MNESPVETCPECGGPVRRVIHPVGIVFKGSGFYVTDSRKKSTAATSASSKSSSSDSPSSSSSEAKSDSPSSTSSSSGD